MPIQAAQYLRMSTESQRYSLVNQAAAIAAFALHDGYEIVSTYEDAGKSGVTFEKREGLKSLLSDVVTGAAEYTVILVLDVSRWGRFQDPDQAAFHEYTCRAAGVDVKYVGEQFDYGPSGSIMKQLKRVMAGEYSRELSAKVKHAKRRNAALGLHQGGACPFGVARLEVRPDGSPVRVLARGERKSRPENILRYVHGDPDEIALVKRVFQLYLDRGMRAADIGRRLATEGHIWTDGQPITSQQVRRVLSCELLTGKLVSGKEEHFLGGRREKRPRSEWRSTKVFAPIISQARFRAAEQRRMTLGGVVRRANDEALLAALCKARKMHGPLTLRIVDQSKHCPGSTNYERAFGSFGRALELIGEKAPRNYLGGQLGHRIPEASLIDAMRRLEDRHGFVSASLLRAAPDAPPSQTYIKAFGSLKAACHVAGVATRSTRKIIIPAAKPWRDQHLTSLHRKQLTLASTSAPHP